MSTPVVAVFLLFAMRMHIVSIRSCGEQEDARGRLHEDATA